MDIATALAARFETEALDSLCDYIRIPALSPAFDSDWKASGAIHQAADHLLDWALGRAITDLHGEIRELPGRTPVILLEIPSTLGEDVGPPVLLYGHLDKQPPLGDWSEGLDPFTPVRRGDLLFGRGSVDDGYALYSSLLAIEALEAAGESHGKILVLIEASEESGSPDLAAHLDDLEAKLEGVELVVCLDSGALTYDQLWITDSLRGNICLTIDVEVLTQGVHSGEASGVVPSSFRILRLLLDRLESPATGDLLIPELNAEIPDHHLSAAVRLNEELNDPLSRHFPTVDGLTLMGRDGADRLIRQSWSATLSVTGFEGAPAPRDAGNVLRRRTSVKLSIRTPPNVDARLAQDAVIGLLSADPPYGATISIESEAVAQGWVAKARPPWLIDALDAASRSSFGKEVGYLGEGGSIPFLAELGHRFPHADLIATGALGPGSHAHGPDESLHVPTAIKISIALAEILKSHANR